MTNTRSTNIQRWLPLALGGVLAINHAVGIAGFMHPEFRELFQQLTPLNLLFTAAVLFFFHQPWSAKFIAYITAVGLAGYGVEVLGVHTGVIFGEYQYGATLGPKVFDVPLMIGVNWMVLVYATGVVVGSFVKQPILRAALAASLMVLLDVFMEPFAIASDMWSWAENTIPVQNYIAWWIISFILLLPLSYFFQKAKNPLAAPVYLIQLFFFLLLWILF